MTSHLLQMRGLKRSRERYLKNRVEVASFTDAWIETQAAKRRIMQARSHLLQMRGLKRWTGNLLIEGSESHLLQMRGLKRDFCYTFSLFERRIFYRCVD